MDNGQYGQWTYYLYDTTCMILIYYIGTDPPRWSRAMFDLPNLRALVSAHAFPELLPIPDRLKENETRRRCRELRWKIQSTIARRVPSHAHLLSASSSKCSSSNISPYILLAAFLFLSESRPLVLLLSLGLSLPADAPRRSRRRISTPVASFSC